MCTAAIAMMNSTGSEALRISYVNVSSVDTSNLGTALVHSIQEVFEGIPEPDVFIASFAPDVFPGMNREHF
jgi:hypothetical protein